MAYRYRRLSSGVSSHESEFDLLFSNGITLKRVASTNGGEYAGPCVFCGGTDRFRVWKNRGIAGGRYWCRACGKSGNTIQLLRDLKGLSFHEACKFLGISPDTLSTPVNPQSTWKPRVTVDPPAVWQHNASDLVLQATQQLNRNKSIQKWLVERGLSAETVRVTGWGGYIVLLFITETCGACPKDLMKVVQG